MAAKKQIGIKQEERSRIPDPGDGVHPPTMTNA
jgi:hypothetical protein